MISHKKFANFSGFEGSFLIILKILSSIKLKEIFDVNFSFYNIRNGKVEAKNLTIHFCDGKWKKPKVMPVKKVGVKKRGKCVCEKKFHPWKYPAKQYWFYEHFLLSREKKNRIWRLLKKLHRKKKIDVIVFRMNI